MTTSFVAQSPMETVTAHAVFHGIYTCFVPRLLLFFGVAFWCCVVTFLLITIWFVQKSVAEIDQLQAAALHKRPHFANLVADWNQMVICHCLAKPMKPVHMIHHCWFFFCFFFFGLTLFNSRGAWPILGANGNSERSQKKTIRKFQQ